MNNKSNVVSTKSVPPKTTMMDRRVKKQANRTGKTDKMQYGNGKHSG